MARPTLDEFYRYMGGAPRTRGWGALLVYDRQKANLLLMQEHILRADTKAWIEPVSGEKETENGKYSKLTNFAFGAPVLSFENSNIGSSMAALSMPVVSGKLTEWSREPGTQLPTLVGISNLDPLTAPRVKMNIKLSEGAGGVVDKDGRVYLDLSESSSYYFEVSQWKELNTKLGELIEEKFKAPERGEQVWELNRMAPVGEDLKPTTFRLRTHSLARAGNAVASTNQADLEEGSIIVGLAFNGSELGDFPDEDRLMPYLLPKRDAGGNYSAAIILSSEVWASAALKSLFENLDGTIYNPAPITYETDEAGFVVGAKGGSLNLLGYYPLVDEKNIYLRVYVGSPSAGVVSLTAVPGGVVGNWTYEGRAGEVQYGVNAGQGWSTGSYNLMMRARARFPMLARMDDSVLNLFPEYVELEAEWWGENGENEGELEAGKHEFLKDIERDIKGIISRLTGQLDVIEYWRLNALLFRNGQRSMPDTFACPGDVTLLGELAPALTAFAISPIEKVLVADGTQALTLTPAPQSGQAVTWEVKALPDDPENPVGPGQLGEVSGGVYKAPKADTIAGTFRQVIITATVGDSSSSALFTIVPKAVAVRPRLLNALYSETTSQRYVLEGGSVGSALTWDKGAGFKGELRDPTAAERTELNIPDDKNVKVYVAPTRSPDSGPVLGALMQLDQVQVSGAGRTETIDITVLWNGTSATLKVAAQGTALKLVLAVQGWGEDPADLPPDQTKWFVAKGKGNLNETTGIYQPGADEDDYVIIAGVAIATGLWNYAVLPMPYTVEDALAFEEVSKALQPVQLERVEYTAEQIKAMEEVKQAFSSLKPVGA
ncbi:hypothetical protein [Pseudomonas putida]|uniref:hypothetical protein n=1 Tax=Pseudomonas putida TaxID=303 RepID=UPI00300EA3AB